MVTWVDQLQAGATYAQVAETFINSSEHRWDQVDYYYSVLLGRAADPTAVTWVNMLQAGVSEQTVVQDIIMSPEFQGSTSATGSFVQARCTKTSWADPRCPRRSPVGILCWRGG